MTGPAAGAAAEPRKVVVIGTGLIGTSVALALRDRGAEVWLAGDDRDDHGVAGEAAGGVAGLVGTAPAPK